MRALLGVVIGFMIVALFSSSPDIIKHSQGSEAVKRASVGGEALASIKVLPNGKSSTVLTYIDERSKLGTEKTGGPFTIVVLQKEGKIYLSVVRDDNSKDVLTAVLE